MAKDRFDGFLRLVPSKKMTTRIAGETQDTKKGGTDDSGTTGLEIDSFSFGNAKALSADDEDEDTDDKEKRAKQKAKAKRKKAAKKKKGTAVEEGYRFKVTKQLESSSPTLMQAYYSNSFNRGRTKYNDFETATVMIRRAGASGDRPKTYLTLNFKNVRVVGYELETEGPEPPVETVEFTFMECEMKYRRQFKDGTLAEPKTVTCNFKKHEGAEE
jgi:type VI protein secretion system component Hcp